MREKRIGRKRGVALGVNSKQWFYRRVSVVGAERIERGIYCWCAREG